RAFHVTGVQTCALPIFPSAPAWMFPAALLLCERPETSRLALRGRASDAKATNLPVHPRRRVAPPHGVFPQASPREVGAEFHGPGWPSCRSARRRPGARRRFLNRPPSWGRILSARRQRAERSPVRARATPPRAGRSRGEPHV